MLELTGSTSEDAPVVKVIVPSTTAASTPAAGPSWRKTAQAAMRTQLPTMNTDTRGMPRSPPSSRTGAASR